MSMIAYVIFPNDEDQKTITSPHVYLTKWGAEHSSYYKWHTRHVGDAEIRKVHIELESTAEKIRRAISNELLVATMSFFVGFALLFAAVGAILVGVNTRGVTFTEDSVSIVLFLVLIAGFGMTVLVRTICCGLLVIACGIYDMIRVRKAKKENVPHYFITGTTKLSAFGPFDDEECDETVEGDFNDGDEKEHDDELDIVIVDEKKDTEDEHGTECQ